MTHSRHTAYTLRTRQQWDWPGCVRAGFDANHTPLSDLRQRAHNPPYPTRLYVTKLQDSQ